MNIFQLRQIAIEALFIGVCNLRFRMTGKFGLFILKSVKIIHVLDENVLNI